MYVDENDLARSRLIRAAQHAQSTANPRAPGVHVSDLIYCLRKSWYRLHGQQGVEIDEDTALLFMAGQGFHLVLQAMGDAEVPVHALGIHGTVDLMEVDPGEDVAIPCEIKSTRYSSRKPIPDMIHYFEQLGTYVLLWGMMLGQPILRGRLYTLHVFGDYRQNRKWQLRARDVFYSPEEMDAWHTEITLRKSLVTADDPPPIQGENHYGWECGHCPLNAANGGPCPAGPGREAGFFLDESFPAWARGV